ncbi:unnamed protein product, partial [Meganyctiphanes norvegica]
GQTTGIVTEIGDGVSQIVPVHASYSLRYASKRLDKAGIDLSNYLFKLLNEREYNFNTNADRDTIKDVKEKLCYVSLDFDKDNETSTTPLEYELPDGNMIRISNER